MTGQRTLPNLGLVNRWTAGSDGWGDNLDADLAMLDALLHLAVKSATLAAPPGSGTVQDGDRYIIPAGATGAWAGMTGKVAVWVDAAWTFYSPRPGWRARVLDTNTDAIYEASGVWDAPGAGSVAGQALPLAFVLPGKPAAGAVFNIILAVPCLLPANLVGSQGYAGTPAAAGGQGGGYALNKIAGVGGASTVLGGAMFAAGSGRATFPPLANSADVNCAVGDVLQLQVGTPADAALADLCITILAKKV